MCGGVLNKRRRRRKGVSGDITNDKHRYKSSLGTEARAPPVVWCLLYVEAWAALLYVKTGPCRVMCICLLYCCWCMHACMHTNMHHIIVWQGVVSWRSLQSLQCVQHDRDPGMYINMLD